jgi:hypothetical protein
MPPELSDAVVAIEIGEQQDVEKLGRGWAKGVEAVSESGPPSPLPPVEALRHPDS